MKGRRSGVLEEEREARWKLQSVKRDSKRADEKGLAAAVIGAKGAGYPREDGKGSVLFGVFAERSSKNIPN